MKSSFQSKPIKKALGRWLRAAALINSIVCRARPANITLKAGILSATAISLFLLSGAISQSSASASEQALPDLQGEVATQYLKQQGLYASLHAAVSAVRDRSVDERLKFSADTFSADSLPQLPAIYAQQTKLTANDGAANDELGARVAISGDTVVVGARFDDVGANIDQGSAYVFVRSGAIWIQQQKLTAADGVARDLFGISVTVLGDTAVIGAYRDLSGDHNTRGAAYVFVRNGTTWTQQQKLVASDGEIGDSFGREVALSGETLVVGAWRARVNGFHQGAAYVFVRSGTTWTQQQKLSASDSQTSGYFGEGVAIDGETIVVGADGIRNIGVLDHGAAYVFVRSGATWTEQQKLIVAEAVDGSKFGYSVSISGETVVVGAYDDKVGANELQGSAYVFVRSGTTWTRQQRLTAADGVFNDRFGGSVALSGDTVVVGAFFKTFGNTHLGAAYVFGRSGAIWTQQQQLKAADGVMNDNFGASVAFSGTTIVVGAPRVFSMFPGPGSAYVFLDCPLITLSPLSLPTGALGMPYNQTVTASGGTAPYTFSLSAGSLPSGLTLAPTGVISGTPVVSGSFPLTIKATAANACPSTQNYTLVVGCPIITITPGTLPTGAVSAAYNQTLTANGGTPPYSFNVSAGALPSGLALSPSGVLSGTPTASGAFGFTAKATDAAGCFGTRAYTLLINSAGCNSITINPITLPNGSLGMSYSQSFTQTGSAGALTWSVSTGTLPGGLSLNGATGTLSGTLTTIGSFTFTIRSTDANNCQGTRQYTVVVSGSGLQFYPLAAPVRLLDTRTGQVACSQTNTPIAGGTSLTQAGRNHCTIPANAQALTGHVTTVQSGGGFLALYPSNAQQPTVASTNYGPNEIINNVFTVGLGTDGAFKIFAFNTTDVVVDVTGYYAPPNSNGLYFHPLPAPVRLLETRTGQTGCVTPGAPLAGNADSTLQAISACTGIPAAARAIVGNATTVGPQGPGFLALFPAGATRPLVASSNYNPGQIVNGPFTTGLAPTGEFKIFTAATTDLVVDVLGYYSPEANDALGAGLLFTPLAHPVRLLETRPGQPIGCFKPGAPLSGGTEITQTARGICDGVTIPANALGVVGNATVVTPSGAGFLTLWPSTASRPLVAMSNYNPGDVGNRHFIVGLGNTDGAFKLFTQATTNLVIDLSGYFAP